MCAGRPSRDHPRHEAAQAVEDAVEVDADGPLPVARRIFPHRAVPPAGHDPGVVAQQIDCAEAVISRIGQATMLASSETSQCTTSVRSGRSRRPPPRRRLPGCRRAPRSFPQRRARRASAAPMPLPAPVITAVGLSKSCIRATPSKVSRTCPSRREEARRVQEDQGCNRRGKQRRSAARTAGRPPRHAATSASLSMPVTHGPRPRPNRLKQQQQHRLCRRPACRRRGRLGRREDRPVIGGHQGGRERWQRSDRDRCRWREILDHGATGTVMPRPTPP